VCFVVKPAFPSAFICVHLRLQPSLSSFPCHLLLPHKTRMIHHDPAYSKVAPTGGRLYRRLSTGTQLASETRMIHPNPAYWRINKRLQTPAPRNRAKRLGYIVPLFSVVLEYQTRREFSHAETVSPVRVERPTWTSRAATCRPTPAPSHPSANSNQPKTVQPFAAVQHKSPKLPRTGRPAGSFSKNNPYTRRRLGLFFPSLPERISPKLRPMKAITQNVPVRFLPRQ
jgi:hypothetical protein